MHRHLKSFVWALAHDIVLTAFLITGAILYVIDARGEPVDLPAGPYIAALVAGVVWFAFKQYVTLNDTQATLQDTQVALQNAQAALSAELARQQKSARPDERVGFDIRGSADMTDTDIAHQDTSVRIAETANVRTNKTRVR